MLAWFKKYQPSLILLLFLILVTYVNSLNNAFLSDDLAEIVNNPNIGNLKFIILKILNRPFGFLRLIFYYLAFHIGGLSPIIFRSINLFFHIGSVFLIFAIVNFLHNKRAALIVASIFAIHPAISEAVVWISGGSYPQYTFFFLLSFLFYLLSKKHGKYYWVSIISFYLSFMSHPQMPLSLFIIFPLWELCFGDLKKEWKKTIPFFILTIVYTLITLNSLSDREQTLQTIHYQEKGIDNIFITVPTAISSYSELLFFPKTLTLYHSELATNQIGFIYRFLLALSFFATVAFSFKKNKKLFFWLSLPLIALAPTLTPFRLNWIVAERYLYLPSLGIFTGIALGLNYLVQKKQYRPLIYSVLSLLILLLSVRTIIRNIDWKNEDNLWIATGRTSPSSPNTHNNLGDVYGRWGDKQRALQEFQTAIALKPNYADAYHNGANTLNELGQTEKALEYYQKAIEFNPNLWQSYQNIAALHFNKARQASNSAEIAQKEYSLALENIQKAILINPGNINLRLNLGVLYLTIGQKDKAKEIFTLVLNADPQNQLAKAGLIEATK